MAKFAGWAILAAAVLSACTSVPPTNVHQPMSVRPPVQRAPQANNGAIYHAATARGLFEDRRARLVGDTLTIVLTETTTASTSANNNLSKTGSSSNSISALGKLPSRNLAALNLGYDNETSFEGSGAASNTNRFSGSISVTVIDVLANGNLLVSGEKQISVGRETQFVRVSGVVNPVFLSLTNSIDSTKVADARIEYKANGQVDESTSMGWLARFFLNVLPF